MKTVHNLVRILTIWNQEQIPQELSKIVICPIGKNGHKLACQNDKGISLLCTFYKVYTKMQG